MKTISIFSTNQLQKRLNVELPETIKTAGALKSFITELLDDDISNMSLTYIASGDPLDNMQPDSNDAGIPSKEKFVVSLAPKSTKFGAVSYMEMKQFVKEQREKAIDSGNETVKNLIGDYTRLNTENLTTLYNQLVEMTNPVSTTTDSLLQELITRVIELTVKVTRLNNSVIELEERVDEIEDELDLDVEETEEEIEDENEEEEIEDELDEDEQRALDRVNRR